MPTKKEAIEGPEEGMLVTAAKAIGTAAGKVAKFTGVGPEPPEPAVSQKLPKLLKKNKTKLPRREKKATQKRAK